MKNMYALLVLAGFIAFPAHAAGTVSAKQKEVMENLVASYAIQAKTEAKSKDATVAVVDAAKKTFLAEAGREFYLVRRTWQTNDYTCSGCHTNDPTKQGKHIETKKVIKPLAPAVNPERFTDVKKVEKNFSDHCRDLHGRDCFAYEKGNFITYLMSVK